MKILIIDDERSIRNSLREILTEEGYVVDVAEDGVSGVKAALGGHYDVIFSDIKMPQMDGVEVLGKLVAEGVDSPVVMISGHADINTAVDCIKKGALLHREAARPESCTHYHKERYGQGGAYFAEQNPENESVRRGKDDRRVGTYDAHKGDDFQSGSHSCKGPYHRP